MVSSDGRLQLGTYRLPSIDRYWWDGFRQEIISYLNKWAPAPLLIDISGMDSGHIVMDDDIKSPSYC